MKTQLLEVAIKAANRMRDNHKEVCRVMMPAADEPKLWEESQDRANVMARFVLTLNPPPNVAEAIHAVRNKVKGRAADNETVANWIVAVLGHKEDEDEAVSVDGSDNGSGSSKLHGSG